MVLFKPKSDVIGEKMDYLQMTSPCGLDCFNLCLIKKMGLESWAKGKAKSVKKTYFKGTWKN